MLSLSSKSSHELFIISSIKGQAGLGDGNTNTCLLIISTCICVVWLCETTMVIEPPKSLRQLGVSPCATVALLGICSDPLLSKSLPQAANVASSVDVMAPLIQR